jgi:cysteine desulfurase
MHYLDYAATTPVPQEVAAVMVKVLTEDFGNPSAQYELGRRAKDLVESSRATIAKALGAAPEQVVFTSCGTEGDNWALRAALWQNRHVGRHIITTAVEHSAVLACCKALESEGYSVTYLKPDLRGRITAEQVAQALREDTALVSMMLVNNETGVRYPVEEVSALLRGKKTLLHSDAVQGFLKVPFSVKMLGADLVTISGHKVGGPKGIGALYFGGKIKSLRPLLYGGGQEREKRPGTEATAQIAGFAKAVELRVEHLEEHLAHMARCKAYAAERLGSIEGLQFVGESDAPHILSLSLPGYPSGNIVSDLDSKGICISAGSACHRGKASHVLVAMGLEKKVAAGTVRVSFGPETALEDIDALCEALLAHKTNRFPML